MYFKFMLDMDGKVLFFCKKNSIQDSFKKWKKKIEKIILKEKIYDANLEDFLKKMKLYKIVKFTMGNSEIKIYENEFYRFFEITNSDNFYLEKFEKIVASVKDKNNTEYILTKRGK